MKLLKNTKLWSGLCVAFTMLFSISMYGGKIALDNAGNVNSALGSVTSIIVKDENAEKQDTLYHKTTVGDGTFTKENRAELWAATYEQNINEMKEGAALLKNDNCLPLKSGARVTLMGHATVQPLYDCMAAGTRVAYAPQHLTTYIDAMKKAGFNVNQGMIDALNAGTAKRAGKGSAKGTEENAAFYEANKSTYAADYKDAAILMFAREGAEGYDILMDDEDDEGGESGKISGLKLHKNELDLLKIARRDFDKVIVLLNSPYQLEVEEIKANSDAILYIGAPGHKGFESVAGILKGEINPSGHIVDTYAVDSLSSPATVNSGTTGPDWANLAEIRSKLGDTPDLTGMYNANENVEKVSVQVENIYIGYRYYETRYADTVYGGRGADSAKGSSVQGAWNYANEVSFPFGCGLSYTTFKQEITDYKNTDDAVEVTVTVTNTGGVAGKSVVQLYMQAPYGEYEIKNEIERSAIELVGYGKTKEIEPGGTDVVKITVDKYLLAAYDQNGAKGYVLSDGDYYFAIGDNAHDALNNILTAQGYTGDRKGREKTVKSYRQSFDKDKYAKGENGTRVTNRFEDRDINYWQPNTVKYLSRNNWDATYPTAQTSVSANDKMIDVLSGKWYKTEDTSSPYYAWSNEARNSSLTYNEIASKFKGLENLEITLAMLRDTDVGDSIWYDFLYQANINDIPAGTGENLSSSPVGKLSPGFRNGDGCDSAMNMFTYYTYDPETGEEVKNMDSMSLRYCSKNILVGTFNDEIIANRGKMMGEEALWGKNMMISGGGYDLHRTPFGGRNFEYMSECPTLTYLASIPETIAMEKTGVHMAAKHFCSNDQETQREGVTVFMREQAFREGSLRAFEGSLRVAEAGGLMASFERIGMIWASADYALNTEVLRGEWGFDGFIVTDASKTSESISQNDGYFFHSLEGFVAGTTNWCFDTNGDHGAYAIKIAKDTNDGYLLMKVIDSAKYWLQGVASSCVMNGIGATDKIVPVTPGWQKAILALRICFGILAGAAAVLTVGATVLTFLSRKKSEEAV